MDKEKPQNSRLFSDDQSMSLVDCTDYEVLKYLIISMYAM